MLMKYFQTYDAVCWIGPRIFILSESEVIDNMKWWEYVSHRYKMHKNEMKQNK